MAELRGAIGAIFRGAAGMYSKKLVFSNSNTVANSDSKFVTAGFDGGQTVLVYGSTSNDGVYTIDTAAAALLTFDQATVTETPSAAVFIYTAAPGSAMTGFYGWSLDWKKNTIEATDFLDAGTRTYIAAESEWKGTATGHWMDDDLLDSYLGTELLVRFFVKYSASPSAPSPVYLYEGLALVTGLSVDTKPGTLVDRPLQFSGVSPLVYRAYTAYP